MSHREIAIEAGGILTTTSIPPTPRTIGTNGTFAEIADKTSGENLGAIVANELVDLFGLPPDMETASVAVAAWTKDPSVGDIASLRHYRAYREGVFTRLLTEYELQQRQALEQEQGVEV